MRMRVIASVTFALHDWQWLPGRWSLEALRSVSFILLKTSCCRFEGAAMHSASGTPRFFGRWSGKDTLPQRLALSTQPGIVAHLKAECSRVYGESITMHYGMRAVGGDVCAGELVLQDAAGEQETRQYDVVVGADGVASAVRQLMQQQVRSSSSHIHVTTLLCLFTGGLPASVWLLWLLPFEFSLNS